MKSSDYQAASSVGWLDYNDEAARKISETLRALEEPSTLDPLGLGSIRDAISDLIAPGTSTIHTRLRYFLFIPWICQRIEKDEISSRQFAERLRDDEATLIECLKDGGEKNGVQGFTSGKKLKRMPSSAYWGGLRSWGIRKRDWSIAEYGRNLSLLRQGKKDEVADETIANRPITIWTAMPPVPANFLDSGVKFALTNEEGQFIIQRIRESNPQSLLAFLCSNPKMAAGTKYPWEINQSNLPSELKQLLLDAQNISELTLGPQLVYNLLVARRFGNEFGTDVEKDVELQLKYLNEWVDVIKSRHHELSKWAENLDALWTRISQRAPIPKPAREFATSMIHHALRDPEAFALDEQIHVLVQNREKVLKTNRSRFVNREALSEWKSPGFGGQLRFRWQIAESYLSDLATALESDD